MTEEEKMMLRETNEKVNQLYTALMEVPPGSPEGTSSLLQTTNRMATSYNRGLWATRMFIWLLPALAGVGVAVQTIKGWFSP